MQTNALEEMKTYLQQQVQRCQQTQQQLQADHRGDEAVFARIEGNVYVIFHTVLQVACQTAHGDAAAAAAFFTQKLQAMPRGWKQAQAQALAHGDDRRAHIEGIKVQAAQTVAQRFATLQEGNV